MAETGGRYYPVSLDVSGRSCLVVGGGSVATRKARGLVERGATVTVIAPTVGPEMQSLSPSLRALETRPYRSGDAVGFRLVITATGDHQVDAAVYADAEAAGVWVNSADDPGHSSFILPSVHRDGTVTIAVSTGGASPALAVWLRTRLAGEPVVAGAGTLAALLGEARRHLLASGRPSNGVDWRALLDGPLPELVRAGALDEARAAVAEAAGG
jgi:precorrin-2 dehydrogenase / sirohydrochlorin ferrochelatase